MLESEAAYHRSLELFETLHAEFPSDSRCPALFCRGPGDVGLGLDAYVYESQGGSQAAL